jgi:OOP family OmpA-OmpF porin
VPLAVALAVLGGCADKSSGPPAPPPIVHHFDCQPTLFFGWDSSTLTEQSKKKLDDLLAGKGCPVWRMLTSEFSFIVRGHSDLSGSSEANMALSLRRAEAVRDFLVSLGISKDRIEVVGYGDTRPLVRAAKGPEPQNRFVSVSLARNGLEQHYF